MKAKMTLFFLEDDGTAALIVPTIKNRCECEVLRASNITAAIDRVTDEPGIDYFDYLIIDLNIPYEESEFENSADAQWIQETCDKHGAILSGWIWLKRYVLEAHRDFAQSRIIVFTAYLDNLPVAERKAYPQLTYINKFDDDRLNKLLEALKPR